MNRSPFPTKNSFSSDNSFQRLDLADVFCRQARRRVDEHVRLLGDKNQKAANSLAERLLNGRYSWLEEGVIAAEDAA